MTTIDIQSALQFAYDLIPFGLTTLFFFAFVWGAYRILIANHDNLGNEKLFSRQLVIMGLSIVALIGIILSLPIESATRNQMIGLVGLVISGILAFASSTVFANLMAGILLRVTKPFKIGDFISVQEHFGRVAERGLFDTEIQSENRELIALPNTYLINNPITTTQSDGAIVSSTLSLGYDEHHKDIETLLIKAAQQSGLEDAFVHILKLDDFSVSYRVSGLLTESKGLITARSNLNRSILDVLHSRGVEIMSPTFMNQRQMDVNKRIIPRHTKFKSKDSSALAEEIVFDKAEQAEQVDSERKLLLSNLSQLEELLKVAPEEERKRIITFIDAVKARLKIIENPDAKLEEKDDAGKPQPADGKSQKGKNADKHKQDSAS